MDMILTAVFYNQLNQGNKGEGDWKPQAYQAVVDELKSKLGLSITVDHVRNRVKLWKRHYAIITEIRTKTKFRWDDDKKMVVITIEDLVDWTKYCEVNSDAKAYQNKAIENWDDICVLVGTDRATGEGAEQIDDSIAAMDMEGANEGESSSREVSKSSTSKSNKKLKIDPLANAVSDVGEMLKEYLVSTNPPKADCEEIYAEVSKVRGIPPHQFLRAVKRFIDGSTHDFRMLKLLPDNQKLDWIMLCLENSD
ncbi:uncharacterized protein LOC109843717 [Asparagus officinalis]|uniref:uncharacterized protein LOC109822574 n=1 Tax=Asparagus officinalis TaxID=4686 RepID=UPI00098E1B8A|nr:uncharacterized protein LOC109822574 [Asparagus officinalis]XP_020268215.1 uncharacterized protein LOC109843673 [Asparagus officinalis]XP_020268260.1 uncharacterized protein LOC109843717 [Asparagus officinalis]